MQSLLVLSLIGVNCFVMITGYFSITNTSFRLRQVAKIFIEVLFYTVILHFVVKYMLGEENLQSDWRVFLPIYTNQYWYITIYVGLMLLAPYISSFAIMLTKQQYRVLLIVLLIMNFQYLYGPIYGGNNGHSLFFFIFLYLLAGYFRLHGINGFIMKHAGMLSTITLLGLSLAVILLNIIKVHHGADGMILQGSANHGMILFPSVLVFLWFSGKKVDNTILNRLVRISPFMLGVYLIHEQKDVRTWLWDHIMPEDFVIPMPIFCVIVTFGLFLFCVFLDYLRAQLFELMRINKLIDKFVPQFLSDFTYKF